MNLVFLALVAATVLLHVAVAGSLAQRWLPERALARSGALLVPVLVLFCFEHSIGLGRLGWVWPLSTIGCVTYLGLRLRRGEGVDWRAELPFAIPFLAALAWRCCFPDIDGHSEQLSDFAMVAGYAAGDRLPPVDYWQSDLPQNAYYGLQHYAAALLGRLADLSAGYATNVAHAFLFGWSASLVWSVAESVGVPRALRFLPVLAAVAGGSGVAPLAHVAVDRHPVTRADRAAAAEDSLWFSVRFAGMFDSHIDTAAGRALFHVNPPDTGDDLPVEGIGYLTYQGDFHAPLSGFMLLFLALACIAWSDRQRVAAAVPGQGPPVGRRAAYALLGLTVPLTLAANTWVFPLQAALVGGWCAFAWVDRRAFEPLAFVAGTAAGLVLLFPFLGPFASGGLRVMLNLVPSGHHTPPDRFIGLLWPVVVLGAVVLLRGAGGWGRAVAVLILVMLVASEIVFVDDRSTDRYLRFNTALKWWSWIYSGAVAGLGAAALARRGPGRWIGALALAAVSTYALDLGAYLAFHDKPSFGRMEGHAWLTRDPPQLRILEWLRAAPMGAVLEGLDHGAGETYTQASALALHAGKPSALGWPHHEGQWRGDPWFVAHDADIATRLYRADVPDALRWLDARDVRYIAWLRRDQARDPGARAKLAATLAPAWFWMPFYVNGDEQLGVWVRK